MINPLRLAALGLLAGVMALGFGLAGHPLIGGGAAVLGAAWLVINWRLVGGSPALDDFGLLIFTGMAAWGLWQGLSAWMALIGMLLALAAWDLGRFIRRQVLALNDDAAARMERTHLIRLGQALGGGLLLGGLALLVRIPLDFGLALLVGFIAVVALSRLVVNVNR
jgi:hypothetical protein